jgi:oxygen-independent coproporphyrinogen-3 oxidase
MAAIEEGRVPTEEKEELSREQQIIEAVYLGLRTTDGIDIRGVEEKFGVTFYDLFGEKITPLKEKGLIQTDAKRCRLTRQGLLFLDSVASALIC